MHLPILSVKAHWWRSATFFSGRHRSLHWLLLLFQMWPSSNETITIVSKRERKIQFGNQQSCFSSSNAKLEKITLLLLALQTAAAERPHWCMAGWRRLAEVKEGHRSEVCAKLWAAALLKGVSSGFVSEFPPSTSASPSPSLLKAIGALTLNATDALLSPFTGQRTWSVNKIWD